MSCRDALRIGVHGGAKNLGRDDVGQIAAGFAADFIAYDTLAHPGLSLGPRFFVQQGLQTLAKPGCQVARCTEDA